jgi:transketolase
MRKFLKEISQEEIRELQDKARLCRGDIIKMTTIAGSGHPGGSMSSIDIYLTLFSYANVSPERLNDPNRDRIIVSHGHTSPGLYACLARMDYFDIQDVLATFRKSSSSFEGHVERNVPGVEWSSGNLGQGLSAGCGFALAGRLHGSDYNTFVVMSDGEQAKGQVAEARRFARKYNLNRLTVIIDHNHIQISGRTEDVMPVNIKDNYLADGWKVLEIPGHDFREIYNAVRQSLTDKEQPYAIIAETTIGKGVSFMENKHEFHGRALNEEESTKALVELNVENDIATISQTSTTRKVKPHDLHNPKLPALNTGTPRTYDNNTHPRVVFGQVLEETANLNPKAPIAVLDCDLAESVKTNKFAAVCPQNFFEAGVSEHTTATIAGALSINGVITVWADFGVFSIDEVYNQLRLNDINQTNLKICATHLGYNVGPDGKTHHCIDYIGLLRNLFGFKLVIPGDPNQTDYVVRYVMNQKGNYVIGLGRTKLPTIKRRDGNSFFGKKYKYEYGNHDMVREGQDCAILTFGPMLHMATAASDKLFSEGIGAAVYNIPAPLDVDTELIHQATATKLIITYEDHVVNSGLGSIVGQIIACAGLKTKFVEMGVEQYGASDEPKVLYKKSGLDTESLVETIKKNL